MEPTDRPRLRFLETHAMNEPGSEGILLDDPDGLCEGQILVPLGLLPIVARFTGEQSIVEIAAALSAEYEQEVSAEDVLRIATDLEERLCLEGDRVEAARAGLRAAFDSLAERPAAHAGSAGYPADQEACAAGLATLLGEGAAADARPLLGLVAPHIDLERGAAGYRAAYTVLRAARSADLYVIFGTGHRGPSAPLTPCRKDFATPLGSVETDRAFVEAVASRCLDEGVWNEELLHLREHSIEFQVLLLKHCLGDRPFRIAPFLTGQLPGPTPDDPRVAGLVDAIVEEAGALGEGRVCFVASADLAHLGPYFGDEDEVSDEHLAKLEELDRESLALFSAGESAAFLAHVEGNGNPRRVCGTAPMFLAERCARRAGATCELLDYGQALAPDRSQVVSFAALSLHASA